MPSTRYKENIDVRFTEEELDLKEDFKEINKGGSMLGRCKELIGLDIAAHRILGGLLPVNEFLELLREIGRSPELKLLCDRNQRSVWSHLITLVRLEVEFYKKNGVGLEKMPKVVGTSIAHNLPKDEKSKKNLINYLNNHGINISESDYLRWLLIGEPNGFTIGGRTPSFAELMGLANYLFPGDNDSINLLGSLWEEDKRREQEYQDMMTGQYRVNHIREGEETLSSL